MCSLHQHWNLVKQHWGGPLRALPTGLIDKLRPLTLFACWHWFAAMPHHQSVLSALDESQSDLNHEAGGRSGKQRPQFSPHTDSGQKKLCLLSVQSCQCDCGTPVRDWWPWLCIFLKLTCAASVGRESSLFYFVYIIRLISLTSPAVECIWKGFFFFPCPQLSRYV